MEKCQNEPGAADGEAPTAAEYRNELTPVEASVEATQEAEKCRNELASVAEECRNERRAAQTQVQTQNCRNELAPTQTERKSVGTNPLSNLSRAIHAMGRS